MNIKYFGFSSLGESLARFFYDCRGDEVYSESQLKQSCISLETDNSEHQRFHEISDNFISRPGDRLVDIPLYVQAPKDAHILLSSNNDSQNIQQAYEIGNGTF